MSNKPAGPTDESWWQFTPRNLGTAYLSLIAAVLLIVWTAVAFVNGGMDQTQIVLMIIVGVAGVALLFQSTAGIRKLRRSRDQQG